MHSLKGNKKTTTNHYLIFFLNMEKLLKDVKYRKLKLNQFLEIQRIWIIVLLMQQLLKLNLG